MSKETRKKSSKSTARKGARASSKTGSTGAKRAKAAKAAKTAKPPAKAGKTNTATKRAAKAAQPKSAKKRLAASTGAGGRKPSKAPLKSKATKSKVTKSKVTKSKVTKSKVIKSKAAPKSMRPTEASSVKRAPRTVSAAAPKPFPATSAAPETKARSAMSAPIPADAPLREGSRLPSFTLPRDGGEAIPLEPAAGRNLVIFFYPRADTPGCTKEAMDFSRLAASFDAAKTDIVGVSADPQRAQEAFRDKHELTMPLLSDENHDVLEAFGVWGEKSMYGRTFLGVLRTTVAVGPDGRIHKIWRNVKVDGHADEVLAYVQSM